MNKYLKSWIASSMLSILILYILSSFVALEINILHWNIWIRFSFVGLSAVSCCALASAVIDMRKEKIRELSKSGNIKKSGFRKLLDKQMEEAQRQRKEMLDKKCMHCEADIKKNEGILLCADCVL